MTLQGFSTPDSPPTQHRASQGMPTQIGPYRVLKRLGAGGMGEVFLAERLGAGGFRRRCCVKTVLPQLSRRTELLELFEREAVLAARVSHENVVQVFDYGSDGDTLYLAMEYVDGISARTLSQVAERMGAAMNVAEATAIIVDVARGLAAIHGLVDDAGAAVGLVHRDVSPDNIMVSRDGLAKLGDFGVARAKDSEPMTETGEVRGKLPYMSPEQVDGHPLTQAADVFSLGVTLFQLLVGRRPFDRGTELATMTAIVRDAPPDVRALVPGIPDALVELVHALLAKRPEDRPTARQVVERALQAVPEASARPTALVARVLDRQRLTEATPTSPPASLQGPAVVKPTHVPSPTVEPTSATRRRPALSGVGIGLAVFSGVLAAAGAGGVYLLFGAPPSVEDAAASTAPVIAVPAPTAQTPPMPAPATPAAAVTPALETAAAPTHAEEVPVPVVAPLVSLAAPAQVAWSTLAGRPLGKGETKAHLAARSVVATDTVTGGRSVVAVIGGVARYDGLGRGTLEVRADPWAEVFVGARALGTTPLSPLPQLVAGSYVVRLVFEGTERQEKLTIEAGQKHVLRVSMAAKAAP